MPPQLINVIKKYQPYISALLIIFSALYIVVNLGNNWHKYQKKFDFASYKKSYEASQWRVPNSKHVISDAELYTYSGYQYIRGENPILINPEQPPLGKYIFGFFILLFGNGNVASLFFAGVCLGVIYLLVFETTQSTLLASIAIALTSTQSLFIDQIMYPAQLDIIQVSFFLITALFILRYKKTAKLHLLFFAGISYGAMLATKVFIQSFFLMTIFLALALYMQNKNYKQCVKEIIAISIIGLSVFILSYISFFLHGGTFRGFLGVQKWIVVFYRSSTIDMKKLFGTYIFLVLFNKWKVWSEGYPITYYQYWSFLWPIEFIVGAAIVIKIVTKLKKTRFEEIFFSVWIILYAISLAFVPVFPRYLLLLFIPILILICIYAKRFEWFS